MSTEKCEKRKDVKKILVKRVPFAIGTDRMLHQGDSARRNQIIIQGMKIGAKIPSLYNEEVIYDSENGNKFLTGDSHLTLVNRLNVLTQSCRTVAKYVSASGVVVEKCSNNVTKLIGQKNYDTVFAALCSVINQEMRVKGILALLSISIKHINSETQTEERELPKIVPKPETRDAVCQTIENCVSLFLKNKERKRIRREGRFAAYVVKDTPEKKQRTRCVIDPKDFETVDKLSDIKIISINEVLAPKQTKTGSITTEQSPELNSKDIPVQSTINKQENTETDLIKTEDDQEKDLKTKTQTKEELDPDEDSCGSIGTFGKLSLSKESLVNLDERDERDILACVAQSSNTVPYVLMNNHTVMLPSKPEDDLHVATPDVLRQVNNSDRELLRKHQFIVDFSYCLRTDEDGNMPIHNAVFSNDLDLIWRMCLVLRARHRSVDILNRDNMSPLQISVRQSSAPSTRILLSLGADPLQLDEDDCTPLHRAAERDTVQVVALIEFCRSNARRVLEENEDHWSPDMAEKTDQELEHVLMNIMCTQCDKNGYTPLMLASKLAKHEAVDVLCRAAPATVDHAMPNSGNTALYLAYVAACWDAADRDNKSKLSPEFAKTIEKLVQHGANPAQENHAGSSVNILLTESSNVEISMIIANNLESKYFKTNHSKDKGFTNLILVKNDSGKIEMKDRSVTAKDLKEKSKVVRIIQPSTKVVDRPANILLNKDMKLAQELTIKPSIITKRKIIIDPHSGPSGKIAKNDSKNKKK